MAVHRLCVALTGLALAGFIGCDRSGPTAKSGTANAPPEPAPAKTAPAEQPPPAPTNATPTPPQPWTAPGGIAPHQPTAAATPPTPPMPSHAGDTPPTTVPDPGKLAKSGPVWMATETSYDFGSVWAGEKVKHTFEFKNLGTEPLKILDSKTKCGCTVLEDITKEVPPAGTGRIPVTLGTENGAGMVSKTAEITFNDPAYANVVLELRGSIKPVLTVEPYEGIKFGEKRKEEHVAGSVKLKNMTSKPLPLKMREGDRGIWKVEFKETKPGMEWELAVSAEPPLPPDRHDTWFYFDTGFEAVPEFRTMASVQVLPRFYLVPTKIVSMPSSRPRTQADVRTVRIVNTGETPIKITSIETSEPLLTPTLQPINPAKSQEFVILVTLPVGYTPPPYGELVKIETTDAENPTIHMWVMPGFEAPNGAAGG